MHAYLRLSIEITTPSEIKDLLSIAGIQMGLAHNTVTMYLTLYDLLKKQHLPVLDERGAIKITPCNVKMPGLNVPFHIGSFGTLMLELCMS
jgi:hypothetical protein